MPLYKRKPFLLLDPPRDLDPSEPVFQARFTKEIFRDYKEYLHRIDLYRRRLWSCKITGKSNLTYEEALVSEKLGSQKFQNFPPQLIKPMLDVIQYSMLSLKNLADAISAKLQESWFEGFETYASKENSVFPCRIERILNDEAGSLQYEIAWLGKEKEVIGNAVVTRKDIICKKFPYSRNVLKSFIRESTWRNAPWVIYDKLAEKHEISRDLPEDLKSKFVFYNGKLFRTNKKRNMSREESESMERGPYGRNKRMKFNVSQIEGQDGETRAQCINYPIEDLLVQPGPEDPLLTDRPAPSRDFKVPMNCVGDLLMVWDFCSSFSRLINLYPFSLEDFENSICHKDGNLLLLVESHSALLHLLIRDGGAYFSALQGNKRNFKLARDEFTLDLVEQCSFLKERVMHLAMTSKEENEVSHSIQLNEKLQKILSRHNAFLFNGSSLGENHLNREEVEEDEEAEQLFRRLRKGKARVRPGDEEETGIMRRHHRSLSGLSIPGERLHRPLIRSPSLGISDELNGGSPQHTIPPPPANHIERERYFLENKVDTPAPDSMKGLTLHSQNGSSSPSDSIQLSEK